MTYKTAEELDEQELTAMKEREKLLERDLFQMRLMVYHKIVEMKAKQQKAVCEHYRRRTDK